MAEALSTISGTPGVSPADAATEELAGLYPNPSQNASSDSFQRDWNALFGAQEAYGALQNIQSGSAPSITTNIEPNAKLNVWKINKPDLKNTLAAVLNIHPDSLSPLALDYALTIAQRIGMHWAGSGADRLQISSKKFNTVTWEREVAYETQRDHFLIQQPSLLGNATLLAIDWLVNREGPIPTLDGNDAIASHVIINTQKAKRLTEGPGIFYPLEAGIRHFWGMTSSIPAVWRGAEVFLMQPGETADIRLRTLVQRTIGFLDKLDVSDGDWAAQRKKYEEAGNEFRIVLANWPKLSGVLKSLLGTCKTDEACVDYLKKYPGAREAFNEALGILNAFAPPSLAAQALEVRALMYSDKYEERAAHPVGRISPNLKQREWQNRDAVISFLRDELHMPIPYDAASENVVWNLWNDTWNSDLTAGSVVMDFDKASIEYKFKKGSIPVWSNIWGYIRGEEYVQMRLVSVMLVALAVKSNKPVSVMSHTLTARLGDVLNHPQHAALKFAYTGRLPSEPTVTREEIDEHFKTFQHLTDAEIKDLDAFVQNYVETGTLNLAALQRENPKLAAFIANSLAYQSYLKTFLTPSGLKTYFTEFLRGQKRPLVDGLLQLLVDDSRAKLETYQSNGGTGGVNVPKKGIPLGEYVTQPKGFSILDAFRVAFEHAEQQKKEGDAQQISILQADDAVFEAKAYVNHMGWADKFFAWPPMFIRMRTKKREIRKLLQERLGSVGFTHVMRQLDDIRSARPVMEMQLPAPRRSWTNVIIGPWRKNSQPTPTLPAGIVSTTTKTTKSSFWGRIVRRG